ncbi:EamA family transporter [Cohnella xylanilytica]|uniref:EamA family transporter n=1 Tax=Cohnella xylanilytica TaxID=557555 RepID=A0A841U3Z8_9BACL|nr:EamA family transporter [Cohnella xylanilytica]MBB6694489.1 EamA family transporter [Cohnella xylanilytica]
MIIVGYSLMCLIFGTTFLAIKIGMDASAPPFFSAGIRFFAAGLILFVWMAGRKKAGLSLLLRKETLATGFCLTFGTFAALYWAEQYVSSGIAAVLSASGPLFILLMQAAFLRQRTTALALAGCLVGFLGVVLLVLPSLAASGGARWIAGCLAVLAGELVYSAGALYSKTVVRRFPDASPIALNAAQMMAGGVLLLLLSLCTETVRPGDLLSAGSVGSWLYLTVAGSMVGHSLFYWLVAKTNPVFPSTWLYVSPLIALAIGVAFYREPLEWYMALGGAAIVAGIALANAPVLKTLLRRGENDSVEA